MLKRSQIGAFAAGMLLAAGAYACTMVGGSEGRHAHKHDGDHAHTHAHSHARAKTAQTRAAGAVGAISPVWAGPSHSGSWFNPARAGEGWTLEMLPDGSVSVVWYTFPTADDEGQAWILGQGGVIDGDTIRFTTVYTARGGRFGPAFDPDDVVLEPWGTLEFQFTGCDAGTMRYAGPAAFGSGSQPIARLVAVRELGCGGERLRTANGARDGAALRAISGSWFDPTHGGEGWVVEALNATTAGVYWFTYDTTGKQVWLLGVGTLDGNRLVITEMQRPRGTRFGAGFDADDVRREPWGTLTFDFTSCNAATVTYTSTQAGFGNGTLNAQRLTSLASAPCLDTLQPPQSQGTWTQAPQMPQPSSEIATAVLDRKIYIAGSYPGKRSFQRYDTVTSQWQSLPELPGGRDHAMAIGYAGKVWIFGGFAAGPDAESTLYTFDPATNQFASIPNFPSLATNGAAELNGFIYVGTGDGSLTQYDTRHNKWRRIPPPDLTDRDHSNIVAYLGEIWMVGGRSPTTLEQRTVTIYDPASETWRDGPRTRTVHSGHSLGVVNQQIVVAGGEIIYGQPVSVIRAIEVISPGADAWVFGPNMPRPVHGVGTAVIDGKFYAVGGSTVAGIATNPGTLQVYTP